MKRKQLTVGEVIKILKNYKHVLGENTPVRIGTGEDDFKLIDIIEDHNQIVLVGDSL